MVLGDVNEASLDLELYGLEGLGLTKHILEFWGLPEDTSFFVGDKTPFDHDPMWKCVIDGIDDRYITNCMETRSLLITHPASLQTICRKYKIPLTAKYFDHIACEVAGSPFRNGKGCKINGSTDEDRQRQASLITARLKILDCLDMALTFCDETSKLWWRLNAIKDIVKWATRERQAWLMGFDSA